jgi:hypothetical protein
VSNCVFDSAKEEISEVIPIYAVKAYRGSGDIASLILNLDTRWVLVISSMPQLLLIKGRIPWYPLDRMLCRPQNWLVC